MGRTLLAIWAGVVFASGLLLGSQLLLQRTTGLAELGVGLTGGPPPPGGPAATAEDAFVELLARVNWYDHVLVRPIVAIVVGLVVGLLAVRRWWLVVGFSILPVALFTWLTSWLQPALRWTGVLHVPVALAACWTVRRFVQRGSGRQSDACPPP